MTDVLLGNAVRISAAWSDPDGSPVEPTSTVVKVRRRNADVPVIEVPVVDGVATFVPDIAGPWAVYVETTGPRGAVEATLNVREPAVYDEPWV